MSDRKTTRRGINAATRREILRAGGAAAAAAALLPQSALAQPASVADQQLELISRARRLVILGGIVLTLDKTIGDFARADILIEDGKIGEVRPNIGVPEGV